MSVEPKTNQLNQFKLGFEYSFIDKNNNIKKYLATNFKKAADKVSDNVVNDKQTGRFSRLHTFHEIKHLNTQSYSKNSYIATIIFMIFL